MSRVNHPGTRERESGASGAKSLDDRHDRVRKDNKKRRRRTASLSFPRNLMRRSDDSSPRGWNTLRGQKRST
jgi:hypothetical protein